MSKPVFKSTVKKGAPPQFTREVKAGEVIFTEGDLGTEMFIVHEGKVEILKEVEGGESKPLVAFEKGDFFGEMAILEDLPRTATARAVTDSTLLSINGSTFDQMLRANPEIAVRMMRKLSRRLRETDALLKSALGSPRPSEVPAVLADRTMIGHPEAGEILLHGKSKMEFKLAAGPETTIGRRDPVTGIDPDIDLTPVDQQRSISRRHAKIYRRDGKFFAAEEIGTMNGTFVNGVRLETGVPIEIKKGDEVRFGVVETVFQP
jgi:CRP-like cAMP-binding protein